MARSKIWKSRKPWILRNEQLDKVVTTSTSKKNGTT